jgi:hypothetical protein
VISARAARLADPRNEEPRATIRDTLHGSYHPGCAHCTQRAQEVVDALAAAGWLADESEVSGV